MASYLERLTSHDDEELLTWARNARTRAAKVGTMSGLWDLIFDAEAHPRGERALLDRATIERMILGDKASRHAGRRAVE